jgi:hypothetical protein
MHVGGWLPPWRRAGWSQAGFGDQLADPRMSVFALPGELHALTPAFIAAALDAGVPRRDVQEAASHADPRTVMH